MKFDITEAAPAKVTLVGELAVGEVFLLEEAKHLRTSTPWDVSAPNNRVGATVLDRGEFVWLEQTKPCRRIRDTVIIGTLDP